jgi:imidazolonepropionase-like amidohydrolase
VDPRELDRLADAGLGRLGALRAATEGAARSAGLGGRRGRTGLIRPGRLAALVVLAGDPLVEPGVWRIPRLVVCDGRMLRPPDGVDVPWPTATVEAGAAAVDPD